jgi:hypothetical protein
MLIKPKSLVVVALSSIVIVGVIISTLVGYYMYVELKETENAKVCSETIRKLQARIFAKDIDIADLSFGMESAGSLKDRPVIKGVVRNRSARRVYNVLLKVRFLDAGGSSAYEVIFHPLEPTFGIDQIGSITMSYLKGPKRDSLEAGSSKTFKRIMPNFPRELLSSSRVVRKDKKSKISKRTYQWPGRLDWEVVSLNL